MNKMSFWIRQIGNFDIEVLPFLVSFNLWRLAVGIWLGLGGTVRRQHSVPWNSGGCNEDMETALGSGHRILDNLPNFDTSGDAAEPPVTADPEGNHLRLARLE